MVGVRKSENSTKDTIQWLIYHKFLFGFEVTAADKFAQDLPLKSNRLK